jgi:hypothetical protein
LLILVATCTINDLAKPHATQYKALHVATTHKNPHSGTNSDWHFNAFVTQAGATDQVRLSIHKAYSRFAVTPDAIYGSSKVLFAAIKSAALEERDAERLTEAINVAAKDGHTTMITIVLEITEEQLKALGFEAHG